MASSLPAADRGGGRRRWRLGGSWLDRYTALVVLGFAAFTLGPSLIGSRVLLSVNLFSRHLPWRADGLTVVGHQICTTDTIDAELPSIAFIRNQLFAGHLGTWQNFVAGGSPMSANPNSGLLDPISWPYLLVPLWLAPAFVMLLQLGTAIIGTNLFLRRLGTSRASGLLAGLIYATTGFMVVWSNWPQTRVGALIPLLLWSVERLIQRVRPADALVIALIVAAMLFGGFPQVAGFGLYLAGGYLVVRVAVLYRRRIRDLWATVGLSVLGLVLGAGLSLVQLLPFVSNLRSTDLSYRTNGLAGLPRSGLVTTVVPNAFGSCIYPNPVHGAINPVELIAYVGAAAVVLAVAGAASGVTRPRAITRAARGYFVAAALVIVTLGWLSPHAREIAVHLPVFAANFVGRIRVILGCALAVLAGLGFETLVQSWRNNDETDVGRGARTPGLRRFLWPALVWIGAALAALQILRNAHQAAFAGHFASQLQHDIILPAILGAIAVLAVLVSRSRARALRVAAVVVVPLLVAVQSASFFHTILPGDSRDEFYPVTRTHDFLKAEIGHDRFAAAGTMFPATSLYYGLRTPTGHTFHETNWRRLLVAVDPAVMASPTNSAFSTGVTVQTIAHQPILDRLAVKYFVLSPGEVTGAVAEAPRPDGTVAVAGASSASCALPAQPLRAIQVVLARALAPASSARGMTLHLSVRNGAHTITSGRFAAGPLAAGAQVAVALAGEDIPAGGQLTATLSVSGAARPLVLEANGAAMACTPITPADDGLKLVYADDASIVYQRLTALPRIRWAGSSTVIAGVAGQVAALGAGIAPGTVVLGSPGPPGSGRPADVQVSTDDGAHIAADVTAAGAGYLVVADAMQQPGWSVTIDGRSAALVDADAAMSAVAVPAGKHHVAFVYVAPDQKIGAALSGVTVVAMFGVLFWDRRRRRPDGDAGNETPLADADESDAGEPGADASRA